MIVKNTKENRALQEAVASLAIEEMYFSEDYLRQYIKSKEQGMTHDDMRRKIKEKYGR